MRTSSIILQKNYQNPRNSPSLRHSQQTRQESVQGVQDLSLSAEQIEQAKSISDLLTAMGSSMANSSNSKIQALGESLAHSGDIGGILSDLAKLEASSADFQQMLNSAAEVAIGMTGSAGGVAALESFLISSIPRALAVGALTAAFPVVGTLALGAAYLGAAYAGGKLIEGAYNWAKDAAETLSSQLSSGTVELPDSFDPKNHPNALVLDATEVNAEYNGYDTDQNSTQYLLDAARREDREFLVQMQKEIDGFNFSLSSLVKNDTGFLYPNSYGMMSWNGGYAGIQNYVIDGMGLNIDLNSNWRTELDFKINGLLESAYSMQEFVNNNIDRADSALGGEGKSFSNSAMQSVMEAAEVMHEITPLALDLSGDGILTRSIFDGIKGFEFIQGEEGAYHGWLDANSGFLAIDRNGNGIIDNGTELFGSVNEDGFSALRRLDSNNDGRIDSFDDLFYKLLVWQDKNQNGISEPDEVMSLKEIGNASISLEQVQMVYRPDINGNTIKWISEYTLESGDKREIADVYFSYSKPVSGMTDKPDHDLSNSSTDHKTQALAGNSDSFTPPPSIEIIGQSNANDLLDSPLITI